MKVTPRDKFGNPLGPGRGPSFDVTGQPGTTTGVVTNNGDGSYTVDVTLDPGSTGPGLVITQPDRPPVVVAPPVKAQAGCAPWMWILFGLFLIVLLIVLLMLLL